MKSDGWFRGGFLCHAASVRGKFISVNLRSLRALRATNY